MISDIFEDNDSYDILNTNTNLLNFSENRLYGYICKGKLYVPDNNFIKVSKNQPVLNFVDTNEAFEKLVATLTTHSRLGRIPPTSKFHVNNIKVSSSYINIHNMYKEYIMILLALVLEAYKEEHILSFQDFFKKFTDSTYSQLYFMSDFMVSEAVSIFSTGLAIQMFDEKAGDLDTATAYIKDKFFRIFKKICLQHNFIIDKHMPWVIVYRVSDKYLEDNISRYMNVYESDMQFLFDAIKNVYIYYVKNVLAKEQTIYADITSFNLTRDSILTLYLKKKLDRYRIVYSDEDFMSLRHFFKVNAVKNGLSDSAYKLDRIEQNFSAIYDDRQQVYLRPGNL